MAKIVDVIERARKCSAEEAEFELLTRDGLVPMRLCTAAEFDHITALEDAIREVLECDADELANNILPHLLSKRHPKRARRLEAALDRLRELVKQPS